MTTFDCTVNLRKHVTQHKELVRIGCGAGFAGDRPTAALRLLSKIHELDYLVLECLAERTLAIRHNAMKAGAMGYDPRISEWMRMLLPEAVQNGVCIITNMGATDAVGAQEEVLKVAAQCGLSIVVGVAREIFPQVDGSEQGSSTYLGAAPIVELLETSRPNVIITTRLADASLFLGPMVFELGWNWNDYEKLAQGILAGHLLECGCQITGGYYMHPADQHRHFPIQQLLEVSLPYAEISQAAEVVIAKPNGSGGELSMATCAQQLLYEVGDPSSYITPDLVVDFRQVEFEPLTMDKIIARGALPSPCLSPEKLLRLVPQDCGWKAWGEISYGGAGCIERAKAAEVLVLSWLEESFPGISSSVMSYLIGVNSLLVNQNTYKEREFLDVRMRMDGLFSSPRQAVQFTEEFEALYTNGPAGGGGISTGYKKELFLDKILVPRNETFWEISTKCGESGSKVVGQRNAESVLSIQGKDELTARFDVTPSRSTTALPSPGGVKIPLYSVAHGRAGDKGNDINFSLIPHCPQDLPRLQSIITREWVKETMRPLFTDLKVSSSLTGQISPVSHSIREDSLNCCNKVPIPDKDIVVEIYVVQGIQALNIVVRDALDGGVNCSRRIDRHGKSLSDLILSQLVILPPHEHLNA